MAEGFIYKDKPDNYTLGGFDYSYDDVLSAANAKGLTIEDYISEYYPEDSVGEPPETTED